MRAKELIDYLTSKGFNVFPDANFIPDLGDDESRLPALFVFSSGGSEGDMELPIEFPTYQIILKGKSYKLDVTQMDKTEMLGKKLISVIHSISHETIGNNLVYYGRSIQSNPIPIGLDTKDRPTFSTNFRFKLQPMKGD